MNCISPGLIEPRDWQFSARAGTPQHSRRDREQHPVGRVGTPQDVAEACLFLAEHAGFMSGQNLVLDGGMTVKMIYADWGRKRSMRSGTQVCLRSPKTCGSRIEV